MSRVGQNCNRQAKMAWKEKNTTSEAKPVGHEQKESSNQNRFKSMSRNTKIQTKSYTLNRMQIACQLSDRGRISSAKQKKF